MEKNYFGAIEFGYLFTTCLIVSYHHNKIDVVATVITKTSGYNDNVITNKDDFKQVIMNIKNKISLKYKINFDEVILVLSNNSHDIYQATAKSKILTERQIIGQSQIDAIRSQIKKTSVGEDRVLIDEYPVSYLLDNGRALRSAPVNYQSSTLAIKFNLHTVLKADLLPIKECLNECDINVIGEVLNCNCAPYVTCQTFDLEGECIHVNILQEVTTISAYKKNALRKSIKVDFGIKDLVVHLANALKISNDEAALLFESYFICDIDKASDIIFDEDKNLSEKRISGIVLNCLESNINVILDGVNKLANECMFTEHYILLTGLLNDYQGFDDLLSKNTPLRVKSGNVYAIGFDGQEYLNVYGAIVQFIDNNSNYVDSRLNDDNDLVIGSENTTTTINSNSQTTSSNNKFHDIFEE